MRIFFISLLLFLNINNCFTQASGIFLKHYDTNDGLSDDHVTSILRDHAGFLWIGTANGLNRYDGYNFKVYLPDFKHLASSVNNEYISDIVQDKNGFIWISTHDGLSRYDPKTEKFKLYKNTAKDDGSLPNSYVLDLFLDSTGILYIVCDNRDLTYYDASADKFKLLPWKSALEKAVPTTKNESYKAIFSLKKGGKNEIILNTKFGNWIYNTKDNSFELIKYKSDPHINFRYQGKLWKIQNGNVFIEGQPIDNIKQDKTPSLINPWCIDYRGVLWLGGAKGLWMHEPSFQFFSTKNTDGYDKAIYKLINSSKGNFQYALSQSKDQLLIFKNENFFRSFDLGGETGLLFEDVKGQIWTSGDGILYCLSADHSKLNNIEIPAQYRDANNPFLFLDAAQTKNGEIWFANDQKGIIVYRTKEKSWWRPVDKENFPSTNVGSLLYDQRMNTMWIGSYDYGLFTCNLSNNKFTYFAPDEKDLKHSVGAYVITSIAKDSLENIWVGTDHGGISKFNYKTTHVNAITTLSMDNGLPSNQIFSLICDNQGDIWAATSKGLALINSINNKIRYFGKEEGIINEKITQPLLSGKNGSIIFSDQEGIQLFDPANFKKIKKDQKLFFSEFKLFDKIYPDSININYLKEIQLNYRQNFFSFELASDDLSNPGKNQFAYLLEGYEKQWNFLSGSHSGSYTNVPPGSYTLIIKGGRDGYWSGNNIELIIIIHPPYWATWWFRTIAAMIFIGSIIAIYRLRVNKIRQEEKTKTDFNKRIAQTEMAALRAQMNPHFIFNCLSSINHFILANRSDDASAYLTKFSRLIRLILDNSRKDTNDLKKELETLQLYLEMEQMRFTNRFNYKINVTPDLNTEEIQIPPMIIQPYIENAIWHGIMHKKTPGNLSLNIEFQDNQLIIEVEDDGIGRKEAANLKSKSASANKSHGMEVTAERIRLINEVYDTRASIEIADLYDNDSKPAGTKVIIKINYN